MRPITRRSKTSWRLAARQEQRVGVARGGVMLVAYELEPLGGELGEQVGAHVIAEVPVDDGEAPQPVRDERSDGARDDGAPADVQQAFGGVLVKRKEASRHAAGEQDHTHEESAPWHEARSRRC
jgi:hypothetical protein